MVCAFKGWNDAGEAASRRVSFIRGSFDAEEIASIDPRSSTTSPPCARRSGSPRASREIDWPENSIPAAAVPGAEGDLVIAPGRRAVAALAASADNVIEAARELGVRMVITLGALLADVPHTARSPITGLGSDEALVERLGFERTSYEGPTGIVGVLHHACAERGLPSASLWASVPHYVAAAPNPKVALALVRAFEGVAGVAVDAAELEEAAEDYERQVSAAVASDPEVKAFVERLEPAMDEVTAQRRPRRGVAALRRHDRPRLPALPAPARAGRPDSRPEAFPDRRTGPRRFMTIGASYF